MILKRSNLTVLACMLILSACGRPMPVGGNEAEIANPASVFCTDNGGALELRTDASGGVTGYCHFPDGSECEEWAYYRGECAPVSAHPGGTTEAPAADGWRIQHNEALGYRFEYPANALVELADDPLHTVTITGSDEGWPSFSISHPSEREEYRPPEATDLETWLVEHNLLPSEGSLPAGEIRMPDTTIARTTAIHTRFERSPQSFAFDKYYFAQRGQLYMIIIGHVNDREDWVLYDRFLQSIAFDD